MGVPKLRLALVVAHVLLTLACLASRAAADPRGAPCLNGQVGELLSAKLAAHAFDGALPAGWTLKEISVARDHIDLGVIDEHGGRRGVGLGFRGDVAGPVDGRGHWFVFVVDPAGPPLDDAGKLGLLDLAARVDAAVQEDETLRVCAARPSPSTGTSGLSGSADPHSWAERGGVIPRWIALPIGGVEVLLVLGVLAFARRSRRDGQAIPWAARSIGLDLAIFALAWLAIHSLGGASPLLWIDTMNDHRDAQRCLVQDACTTLGEATSVDGVYHTVGWLDFIALAGLAGLAVDGQHLLFQVLSAVSVMLTASSARQCYGRTAGLFGGFVCLGFIGKAVNVQALYNTTALPFLGAVFLLAGIAAVKRPGPAGITLTALIGGVLASVHSACVLSLVSVVWIALLAPRHGRKLAALGAVVFVGTALVIGPAAWLTTIHHVFSALTGASGAHRVASGGAVSGMAIYGFLTALALTARRLSPHGEPRLPDVALAIVLPMLAASFAAAAVSSVPTSAKYLAHVAPAGGVLVAALLSGTSARIRARMTDRPARAAWVAPLVLYGLILSSGVTRLPVPRLGGGARPLSFHDAAAIPRVLADRGWTYAQVYRSLRAPDSAEILASFEMLAPGFPLGPDAAEPTIVYVAKVDSSAVPKPLPENWVVARQDWGSTVLLVFTRSFLSWDHFAACDPNAAGDRDACRESGLSLREDAKPLCVYCVPGMPPFQTPGEHAFELRMSVRGVAAEEHVIVMPSARPQLCAGAIASVRGGAASISNDHRRARWVEPPSSSSALEVRLDWTIGSSDCETNSYSGLPPFFLEGDPQTVEQLERLGL